MRLTFQGVRIYSRRVDRPVGAELCAALARTAPTDVGRLISDSRCRAIVSNTKVATEATSRVEAACCRSLEMRHRVAVQRDSPRDARNPQRSPWRLWARRQSIIPRAPSSCCPRLDTLISAARCAASGLSNSEAEASFRRAWPVRAVNLGCDRAIECEYYRPARTLTNPLSACPSIRLA